MKQKCIGDGCEKMARCRDLCDTHYSRLQRRGDINAARHYRFGRTCEVDGCDKKHMAKGYCSGHYQRFRITGSAGDAFTRGSGYIDVNGYRRICVDGKELREHRFLMEQHLGRPLMPNETVHHINGVRHDNRMENLELWSKAQPYGQRVMDKVAWALELLDTYAPDALSHKPYQMRI